MMTGELFGAHYGNLYQLDPNTGAYTNIGSINDGSNGYDPTCLFMTYGSNPSEFTVGDLNYRVNDDHVSVTVIGHVNGYDAQGPLNIPASVSYEGHDYTVTTIGNSAFLYCFYLTNLSIPNSVTTIEEGAFAYCSGFTGDLVIPNSVVTIEPSAFYTCYSFDGDLVIGNSVTFIGDYAFRQCSGFTGAVSLATTPPELGNEPGWNCVVFQQFGYPVLTVPCGSIESYQNSPWYDPYGMVGFFEFVEDCTAISESEAVVTSVYPNPTCGKVTIEAKGIRNVVIFNLLGAKVFESPVGGDIFEYDFNRQEAGVYLIIVETAQGSETKRITVL